MARPIDLPQLSGPVWITDAGLETWLVFLRGMDLPCFAAFPLIDDDTGRDLVRRYFEEFFDIAERDGTGVVVDTITWRANPDWGARLGYDRHALHDVNRRAVELARELAGSRRAVPTVIDGVIGPRGDGYVVEDAMTPDQAAEYHRLQTDAFASAGADMATVLTMNYTAEAIGVVEAARGVGLPVVVSFTVETDGRLPTGQRLGDAIEEVDSSTGGYPSYYMVNCAHPTHFADVLAPGSPWLGRLKGVRANASPMSHAELDEAEELDRGDPVDLASRYAALRSILPDLRVVGGCCGTDHEHVSDISATMRAS